MSITLDTCLQQAKELLSAPVDDDLVLLDLQSSKYYGMGEVGRAIWELLAEPHTVDFLCHQLRGEFAVDAQTCRDDVLEFVRHLEQARLLTVVPAPAESKA